MRDREKWYSQQILDKHIQRTFTKVEFSHASKSKHTRVNIHGIVFSIT